MSGRTNTIGAVALLFVLAQAATAEPRRPNIIFLLADDLGIGDVQCFNPQGVRVIS